MSEWSERLLRELAELKEQCVESRWRLKAVIATLESSELPSVLVAYLQYALRFNEGVEPMLHRFGQMLAERRDVH